MLGSLCLSPSNAADLKCKFRFHTDDQTGERFAYTCINDEELPVEDPTVTNVIGDHLYKDKLNTIRFTNADVEIVEIESAYISEIPKGLIKIFPSMSKLSVTPKLYGFTQNDYLDLFQKLKKLEISVDYLPDNVFDDLVNLQELILMRSELTSLPPMVFDQLLQLEVIKIHGSPDPDYLTKMDELPAHLFKNNLYLRDVNFHHNGLTCIRDGLLDGLVKLETVSFDNHCIKADLSETVTLSVIKDKIHKDCQKCFEDLPSIELPIPVAPVVCPAVPGHNDPPGCPRPVPIGLPLICPSKPGPNDPLGCPRPVPEGLPPICPSKPGPFDPPGCHQPLSPMPICTSKPGPNNPPGCLQSCPYRLMQLQEEYNKLKTQKDCNSRNTLELIFKHKQNK